MRTTNFKFAVVMVGFLALLLFIARQHYQALDLAAAKAKLRDEVAQLKEAEETRKVSESRIAQAQSMNEAQLLELLRRRAQVTSLRAQLIQATNHEFKTPSSWIEKSQADASNEERYREDIVPRCMFARNWMSAFINYANENQGRVPTNFELAEPFLSLEARGQTNVTTDEFEIVYQGSLNDFTSEGDADVIVLRERQLRHRYDGKYGRVYGLADGASLQRFFDTEDALTLWEQEHLRKSASP